ncbi:guanylate-binding protein 1-like [Mercenaria mercenaria]|uniref:guanylate-binding protein 1-like n=1 Tax=Mercenaria mercenaria TaxID=6596 RepID=UPI00234E6FC0|nr:guanylate-binding protein 1-like [Mercenaria mercenaria]
MCLISSNKEGCFSIEDETLNQIKLVDYPLVVVAIAGLYRTGKSYLMNRLAGSHAGFQLGNTIQSKTKGIWAWCRPHPKKENHVILLLDTEGLGDVAKGDIGHDNKIFTLAALLCNVLVYNMMSTFNNDAVEKLTFITEMSKNIKFKKREEMDQYSDAELALILPTFVLCVRDFTLELKKDGVELTEDQYLEDCLELKPEKDSTNEKFNKPRECIIKYFPTRKCFTFDRPGDKKVIQRLESISTKELSKSFVDDTERFMHFVYECKGKVLLGSKPVRGTMFATLVESYVQAIRQGAVPDVDDAITAVSKLENERVAAAALQSFSKELASISLPVFKKEDFRKLFHNIQKSSLLVFRYEAMFDSEQVEKKVTMKMEELWKEKSKQNKELIRKHCNDQLQDVYNSSMGKDMCSRKFKVAGGYSMYKVALETLKANYKSRTENIEYYEVQGVWHKFLESEATHENEIMMADQELTEADRKRELDKIQKDNEKVREEQKILYEKMLKEEKDRVEKHFAKLETDRQTHVEDAKEKMQILMDTWRDQKEQNEIQIQMMTTENEKQREELKQEIHRLNEECRRREQVNEDRFKTKETEYKQEVCEMKNAFKKLMDSVNEEKALLRQQLQRLNNRSWYQRLFNIEV